MSKVTAIQQRLVSGKTLAKRIMLKTAENVLRPSITLLDNALAKTWEWRKSYRYHGLSSGELTSQLKRMGIHSFRQYVIGQMLGHFGARNFLPTDCDIFLADLRAKFPEQEQVIQAQADRLVSGKFDLLGSGLVDMKRFGQTQGWKIDWCKDPISGENYKNGFSHWRWSVFGMRPGSADIKGPWELTRCQHFVTLGQAYWLTRDEKYAKCYAKTILDFIKHNPPGFGIHWACTMDVALRVVGWLSALNFFQGSKHLNYRFWKKFLTSLVEHGRFITANLEYGTFHGKLIFSNHGIANLFGLYWLAMNFPALDAACVWRGIAETGLEQQIQIQILEDGGPFESSIPYHRLVLEMFLSAYALSQHVKLPLSEAYKEKLIKGLKFVARLRQDSGRIAQIGDADNGRGHIFSEYGTWSPDSMDHLLVAAAKVLDMPELAANIPVEKQSEAMCWPGELKPAIVDSHHSGIDIFATCGIASLRNGDSHVTFANLGEGTHGIGNHKHCDQLAIEWCYKDHPIFVDAGSYTYTQDPDARNKHRATAIHNTVMINNTEQHEFDPTLLFSLQQQGTNEFTRKFNKNGILGIEGKNTAYNRLTNSVEHSRRIMVLPCGSVIIEDQFHCEQSVNCSWNFTLYPNINPKKSDIIEIKFSVEHFSILSDFSWDISDSWYSPGYGERSQTHSLTAECMVIPNNNNVILIKNNKHTELDLEKAKALSQHYWSD